MAAEYQPFAQFERLAFQALNAVVEPLVRAGVGGPLLTPIGAIVLETTGRKTGDPRRTPLLATVWGNLTIVATFRAGRSQWVKNLAVQESAKWWVNGELRSGKPIVFAQAAEWPEESRIPELLRPLTDSAWRPVVAFGWAVAVLVADSAGW